MDINALSPAEKDQLLTELVGKYMSDGGSSETTDGSEPVGLDAFAQALEIVIDKMESMDAELCRVRSMVEDDLFGGIRKLYDSNMRMQGIAAVRSRYGSVFADMEDGLKTHAPDDDWAQAIYDIIEQQKSNEGFDEGKLVNDAAAMLRTKLGELGKTAEAAPAAVEVEVTKTSTDKPDDTNPLIKKIREMKTKNKSLGLDI